MGNKMNPCSRRDNGHKSLAESIDDSDWA